MRRHPFRPPWPRVRPADRARAVAGTAPHRLGTPRAGGGGTAREAVAARFGEVDVAPGSAFTDAVLPVAGEPVVNVLRHAPRSPAADVGITGGTGRLVVGTEPRLPGLEPDVMGAGLQAAGTRRSRNTGRPDHG